MADRSDPRVFPDESRSDRVARAQARVLRARAAAAVDRARTLRETKRRADATVYATRAVTGPPDGATQDGAPGDGAERSTWTVREVDARGVPGAHGPRCLVFENTVLVRRVWTFPPTWAKLPDDALLRIAGLVP